MYVFVGADWRKWRFRVQKEEFSSSVLGKHEHMHEMGREKLFEVWLMESIQFFSANFNVITVFSQSLLKGEL